MSTVTKNRGEDSDTPDETEIDARIHEVDMLLDQLHKRKHDLVEARESLGEGRKHEKTPPLTRYVEPVETKEDREKVLGSLAWKDFGPENAGQWTFVNDKRGNLMKDLIPIRDLIESMKQGNAVTVGNYRYRISENGKFLNRFPVMAKQARAE